MAMWDGCEDRGDRGVDSMDRGVDAGVVVGEDDGDDDFGCGG